MCVLFEMIVISDHEKVVVYSIIVLINNQIVFESQVVSFNILSEQNK